MNNLNTCKTYVSIAFMVLIAGSALGAKLGMDRESYGVYDRTGGNSVEEFPFTVGQAYRAEWRHVNPARNTFDWSKLDELLQFAYDQKQKIYIHIKAVQPPSWIYETVPRIEDPDNDSWIYGYYMDPDYKVYYGELIAAYGNHLRNEVPEHLQDLVAFVRVDIGVHGDERPYDRGNQSNIPPEYRIPKEDWEELRFWVFDQYNQAFQKGPGYKIPLMFKHAEPFDWPEAWEWVTTNVEDYGARYLGDVRGHHLSGSRETTRQFKPLAVDSDHGLFSRNEMDLTWSWPFFSLNLRLNMYWCAVEQLHPGLSIWDVYRAPLKSSLTENYAFAFEFFNKWAAELVPATAGGGFLVFHEGLDSSDTEKFPESIYGNASQSNTDRYLAICNAYADRGAQMDDLNAAPEHQVWQRRNQTGFNDAGWQIVRGNYDRFITQIDPDNTSIGLFRVNGPLTQESHPFDRFARSFDSASGKDTMYFDIHDDLVDSETQRIKLSVTYLDRGTGSFELQYDAVDNHQKTAFVVNKTGSNTWKTHSLVVTDGLFRNNGPRGSDLMLINGDSDDDIFHMLELNKLADVQLGIVGKGSVRARHGSTYYEPVSGTYMEGTRLELTATPDPGWKFVGWKGDFSEIRDNWARLYPTEYTQATAQFAYIGSDAYNGTLFTSDPLAEPNALVGSDYLSTLTEDTTSPGLGSLVFEKLSGPDWLHVASNGTLSGTPATEDIGRNIWTIRVTDGDQPSDEASLVIHVGPSGIQARLEAEEAGNRGLAVKADSVASGGLQVDLQEGGDLEWTFHEVSAAGTYKMVIRYNTWAIPPTTSFLSINGGSAIPVVLSGAQNQWSSALVSVPLDQGNNTIRLTSSSGGMFLDYIEFPFFQQADLRVDITDPGQFALTILCFKGVPYDLLASDDLQTWFFIDSFIPHSEVIEIQVDGLTGSGRRFFRVAPSSVMSYLAGSMGRLTPAMLDAAGPTVAFSAGVNETMN